MSNTPPNVVHGDESGFFAVGIQSCNPKEFEILEKSEDEPVLLCIRSEPHDMAGVGLGPDVYHAD